MLKVGGIWVSPVEVENALNAHPVVRECAVVGQLDQDGLVKPAAFVVLNPSVDAATSLAAELQRFVRDRLADYKRPRWIHFVAELPKTATGKTQRFKLRSEVTDGLR
jgi:acyl-coenzyme A synthetase/AMP-(fatty) acid ligase